MYMSTEYSIENDEFESVISTDTEESGSLDNDIDSLNISGSVIVSTRTEDCITNAIGEFGSWQYRISVMMALLKFPISWFQLGIVFLAPKQEFWCKKPNIFKNISDETWRTISKPPTQLLPCMIYDPDTLYRQLGSDLRNISLVPCEKFDYDDSVFVSTIISEWNLVCSRHGLAELAQASLMMGALVGNLLFGALGDRYGRKRPLVSAIFIQSIMGILSALTPWFWGFIICRFAIGIVSGGIAIISFVMCMEIVSGKYRTTIPILYQIPFGIGNSLMAGLAYLFRDWRKLQMSTSILSSIYLVYFYLVPESPRWLLATGRREKATAILEKAAKVNGRDYKAVRGILNSCRSTDNLIGPNFSVLFKTRNLRNKTTLLCLNWFFTGLCFFAFSEYLGQLGSNVFLTVATGGAIATPGAFICIYVVRNMGRKAAVGYFQILTAICFLMIMIVSNVNPVIRWPRVMFAAIGIVGMSVSVPALYLFSGELFPTVARNVGVGGVALCSRLGSLTAPFVIALEKYVSVLPMIILTAATALQAVSILPLPDTKDCPLQDTLEQAETFTRKQANKFRKESHLKNRVTLLYNK